MLTTIRQIKQDEFVLAEDGVNKIRYTFLGEGYVKICGFDGVNLESVEEEEKYMDMLISFLQSENKRMLRR